MSIQDFSDLRFTMTDMERYFQDGNIQISDKNKKQLNTIFHKCDKKDEQGNKVKNGDGALTGEERTKFLDKIKNKLPSLYETMVNFSAMVDATEDIEKQQQEMLKELEKEKSQREIEAFNGLADSDKSDINIAQRLKQSEQNRAEYQKLKSQKRLIELQKSLPYLTGEAKEKAIEEMKTIEQKMDAEAIFEEAKKLMDEDVKKMVPKFGFKQE